VKRYCFRIIRTILLFAFIMAISVSPSEAQSITYVTNAFDDSLAVIYTATHEIKNAPVRAIIPLRPPGSDQPLNPVDTIVTPYAVRGNATGQFVYTVNKDGNSVSVINTAKAKLIQTIALGAGNTPVAGAISGVRLHPTGGQCSRDNPLWRTFLYVVNSTADSLSIIDTDPKSPTWNTVVKTIPVGHNPTAVAVSKPTLEEYALAGNPNVLEPHFSSGFYVMVTNSADNTVTVIGADYRSGTEVYGAENTLVGCGNPSDPNDKPAAVDFHQVIATLDLNDPALDPFDQGVNPSAISFERYGRWAYVTNQGTGNVSAIDACPQSDVLHQEPPELWVDGRWCHKGFSPQFTVVKAIGLNTDGTARPLAMPSDIDITIDLTGTYVGDQFRAYVANPGDDTFSVLNVEAGTANFQKSVFVCDRNNPSELNPEACPKAGDHGTKGSLMYPDEDFYYLVNNGSNSISVIDADPDSLGGEGGVIQYNHEVGRISRGLGTPCPDEPLAAAPHVEWCGTPLGIDNTPRIPYAYVMNSRSKTITVHGASPQIQEPPDDHPVLHTIELGWRPTWVTLNRNQDFIFISDPGPYPASDGGVTGRVHVINTMAQLEVGYTTQNIGTPLRIATPPDGWSAYVTSSNGRIYTVDTVDRSGPGGPGDPFTSGGANDVTFPIPGTPGFAPMKLKLRECPRGNPVAPCDGQVGGGDEEGQGNPTPVSSFYVGQGLGGLDVHPDTFVGLVAVKSTQEVVAFDTHYDHFGNDGDTWNTVLARIPIPLPQGYGPLAVAFTHDGTRALVLNSNGTVRIIQTITNPTGEGLTFNLLPGIIQVGKYPTAVAFNELDEYAYVVNSRSNTVSAIDLSDPFGANAVTTIPVGKNPQDIFINLGERVAAYVTNKCDGTVSIIDVLAGSPGFNTVVETVQLVNITACNPAVAVCPREIAPVGLILTEP
jgi:YVTN family beta-propeller protein